MMGGWRGGPGLRKKPYTTTTTTTNHVSISQYPHQKSPPSPVHPPIDHRISTRSHPHTSSHPPQPSNVRRFESPLLMSQCPQCQGREWDEPHRNSLDSLHSTLREETENVEGARVRGQHAFTEFEHHPEDASPQRRGGVGWWGRVRASSSCYA
jgi:hypothetical protein